MQNRHRNFPRHSSFYECKDKKKKYKKTVKNCPFTFFIRPQFLNGGCFNFTANEHEPDGARIFSIFYMISIHLFSYYLQQFWQTHDTYIVCILHMNKTVARSIHTKPLSPFRSDTSAKYDFVRRCYGSDSD